MLAFIQIPYFASDAAILVARGFQPIYYLPELLLKQLVLAVVITLSAASLATVTRNLPQFALAGVVIVALGLFCVTRMEQLSLWLSIDQVRRTVTLLVLAPFGTVIVLLQYSRRRTALSRLLGLGAILLAGMLFLYLPRSYTSAFGSEAFPVPANGHASSVRVTSRDKPASYDGFRRNVAQFRIRVIISGIPQDAEVEFDKLAFEIRSPRGESWKMNLPADPRRWGADTVSGWLGIDNLSGESYQLLILGRSIYERIKGLNLTLSSEVAIRLYRGPKPVWMPVMASEGEVPGVGRCSSVLDDDPRREAMLDAFCESPAELPLSVQVRLADAATGRVWNQHLGDAMSYMTYPVRTWLSPLNRRQTFFHLTDELRNEGDQWLAPRSMLSSGKVGFIPLRAAGYEILKYQIPDVNLDNSVAKSSQPSRRSHRARRDPDHVSPLYGLPRAEATGGRPRPAHPCVHAERRHVGASDSARTSRAEPGPQAHSVRRNAAEKIAYGRQHQFDHHGGN